MRFYRGDGSDHAGRTLEEILGWDDWHLEEVHDYIQWLFPLPEPSRANSFAPLLTAEDIRVFRESGSLGEAVHRALTRMLAFYGLEAVASDTGTLIRRSSDWTARSANWLRSGNHNHLRLTRIVRSLTLLGLSGEARALSSILLGLAVNPGLRVFSRTTIRIWREASLEADRAAGELGTTSRERESR